MIALTLFFQFMKYGLLCFGGGYMIIPLLYADLVEKAHIFTPESYGNMLAVSQMTPGPVSVNTATYAGFIQDGLGGAIAATSGLCMPTLILCVIVVAFLERYKDKALIIGFFKGVKWAALIMILSAIVLFAKISILSVSDGGMGIQVNWCEVGVMIMAICLARKVPFTLLLLLSASIGYIISYL